MSDLFDAVTVLERIAAALERQVALQERDELRRSVRGLIRLQRKYGREEVRARRLRVVR